MSRTARVLGSILIVMIGATGCHARFRKFCRTADNVGLKVVVDGSPLVDLSENTGSANPIERMANAAVGTAAQVDSVKVSNRLQRALQPKEVRDIVNKGVVDALGNGPPFGTDESKADGLLQIEVTRYGIVQSGGGPQFFVDYRVRAYRATDNKRVYSNDVTCSDSAFNTIGTPANIAGTVATMAYVNKLTDQQLAQSITRVVRRCTGFMVSEMRKHAG